MQNLQVPWSLVFLPNGDALVSERRGRIQRIPRKQTQPKLYIKINEVGHSVWFEEGPNPEQYAFLSDRLTTPERRRLFGLKRR